MASSVGEK
uniref:Uncharacterized protein n=1 Tax=Arundo donax TaxID=35708 RepID=A0A0A9CE34_ARUDO